MPFKKGDVVEVKVGQGKHNLPEGGKYTIYREYHDAGMPGPMVDIHDEKGILRHGFYARRFKLVEPVALVFTVGAQVERTGPGTMYTEKGGKYIIETVYRDELGGVQYIKLQGINTRYHVRDFKVLANAKPVVFDREAWIPQVGEMVFITGRDEYSNGATMDAYINDGKEYTIRKINGERIYLYDHEWMYLSESLTPKWAMKGGKPIAPPPLKDLREALYQHQEHKGLGSDLCSYAFETKDGKQHLYPYVCHARLNNEHGEIVRVAYGFRHDMARVVDGNKEAHKAYAKYIISESPWAKAFITQDIEEAIAKDIYMNVEVNRYMMAGACVALRTGQEYPDRPVIFKAMLDLGHSPHTCWLISCAFAIVDKDRYNFNSWTGGHDVIDKYRKLDDVIKFFQQGYHLEDCPGMYGGPDGRRSEQPLSKDPYRTHHGSYVIANAIANYSKDKTHGDSIGAWFEKNTAKSTVGQGWDKKTLITAEALDDVATKLDKLIKGAA